MTNGAEATPAVLEKPTPFLSSLRSPLLSACTKTGEIGAVMGPVLLVARGVVLVAFWMDQIPRRDVSCLFVVRIHE